MSLPTISPSDQTSSDRNILEHVLMPAFSTWKTKNYCKAAVSFRLLHQIALGAAGQKQRVSFNDIYGVDGFFLMKKKHAEIPFFL